MDSNHGRVIDSDTESESVPPQPAEPGAFPWPPLEHDSTLDALVATWRTACFQPRAFFARMPKSGDYGWVLGYYLVIGVVAAGIELFWQMTLGWNLSDRLLNEDRSTAQDIVAFLLSPVLLIGALYLATGVCHLILLVLRGARHGFETSTRVFAFAYSPALFNVIPVVGNLISVVWMAVLAIVGLREAHRTDGAKSAAAVLIPLFLLIGFLLIAFFASLLMGVLAQPL